jgi:hypothetical protein
VIDTCSIALGTLHFAFTHVTCLRAANSRFSIFEVQIEDLSFFLPLSEKDCVHVLLALSIHVEDSAQDVVHYLTSSLLRYACAILVRQILHHLSSYLYNCSYSTCLRYLWMENDLKYHSKCNVYFDRSSRLVFFKPKDSSRKMTLAPSRLLHWFKKLLSLQSKTCIRLQLDSRFSAES